MDKYEYRVKAEQILQCVEEQSFEKAREIAETIDWRKVKNAAMICTVSDVYERVTDLKKSRDILFIAYDRAPGSRKIVYRLGTLALKIGDINEATDCYEEFIKIAPKDPNQHILKFKILKAQKAPIEQQIAILEEFKKAEYVEKWAYELAKLYDEAGMTSECLEECDDLILWFSEGPYVYRAMELKMKYKPLTPLQQEKFKLRNDDKPQAKFMAEEKQESVEKPDAAEEIVEEPEATLEEEEGTVEEPEATLEEEEGTVEEPEAALEEAEGIVEEPEAALEEAEEILEEAAAVPVIAEETMPLATTEDNQILNNMLENELKVEDAIQLEARVKEEEGDLIVEDRFDPQTTGQMKIEEILKEWEAKQRENAKAIQEVRERAESEKQSIVVEAEQIDNEPESELSEEVKQLLEEMDDNSEEVSQEQNSSEQVITKEIVEDKGEAAAALILESEDVIEESLEFYDDDEVRDEEFEDDATGEEAEVEEEEATLPEPQTKPEIDDREIEDPVESTKKSLGGVTYDTGYVVQGRYDLSATSEIGLKMGLTEEQKQLFSYFVPVRGMSEQLFAVLESDKICKTRYGTSRTGNLLVIGRKGSGKTVLAVDVVKAIQKQRKLKQGKVAIVTGESLNNKDLTKVVNKLHGGAVIIENAGKLSVKKMKELNDLMEEQTGELFFVLEDQRKALERMLTTNPAFKKKFNLKLELPIFINDELVTFGQIYAKENGYLLDEMGILALYSRIDLMQREDHAVTVAEVKEIMDDAIASSRKANVKSLVKRVFGKNTDDSDRIILQEQDFKN